jgi:hypothetical protein
VNPNPTFPQKHGTSSDDRPAGLKSLNQLSRLYSSYARYVQEYAPPTKVPSEWTVQAITGTAFQSPDTTRIADAPGEYMLSFLSFDFTFVRNHHFFENHIFTPIYLFVTISYLSFFITRGGAVQLLNAVDPYLECAWFLQPLNLSK